MWIIDAEIVIDIVNCKQTFEGIYQFSYEQDYGGGGICNNTNSLITACQLPGSPYVDNQVFYMNWGRCANVQGTSNKGKRKIFVILEILHELPSTQDCEIVFFNH